MPKERLNSIKRKRMEELAAVLDAAGKEEAEDDPSSSTALTSPFAGACLDSSYASE